MTSALFHEDSHLPPMLRVAYVASAVVGSVVVFFTVLMVVIEITTTRGVAPLAVNLTIGSAVVSVWHIVVEARSAAAFSMKRWSVFTIALLVFGVEVWTTIHDPTGKRVFVGMLAIGGVLLAVARLIIGSHPPPPEVEFEPVDDEEE